jgi:hypothetical protein
MAEKISVKIFPAPAFLYPEPRFLAHSCILINLEKIDG